MDRPTLRRLFLSEDRQLEVFFYTSNLQKFLQANLVFQRSGLQLKQFKSKTDPYLEDYTGSKEQLLSQGIREITSSLGRNSLLFVEDTSVRVDAISTPTHDYPGLSVKEWFAETRFENFNEELVARGNDRRATVKSGIALHVPSLPRPVFFRGETTGRVADCPPEFEEQPQYPWLTPNSFNGWFIPDGASVPLGAMSIDESWRYDFRIHSLVHLVDRLEEYTAALNLPHTAYVRRRRTPVSAIPSLFPPQVPPVFVVVGPTCAGKTTFGDYVSEQLAEKQKLRVIEASSVVRMIRANDMTLWDVPPDPDPAVAAAAVLNRVGADAAAREILEHYSGEEGLVITGFRTIEELETLQGRLPQAKVVLLETRERLRFSRLIARNRVDNTIRTLDDFRYLDAQQRSFGLLRVAEDFADVRIKNEGPMDAFRAQIAAVVTGADLERVPGVATELRPRYRAAQNQLYRCLAVLVAENRPLQTNDIERLTGLNGRPILHNNANKVLRRVPELAQRMDASGTRVRYEATSAGRAYVRLVDNSVDPE